MSDPYLGEIKIVGSTYAPQGYAVCNGQMMSVAQYSALFSVLGIRFGGNGVTTFGLPNLQAAAPMGAGNGPGLEPRTVGDTSGVASVSLMIAEIPTHDHGLVAAGLNPPNPAQNVAAPTSQAMVGPSNPNMAFSDVTTPAVAFSPLAIGPVGGSQPHENRQPLLALNFVIALQGIYPARN